MSDSTREFFAAPAENAVDGSDGGVGPKMECGVCWQVYDPALGDEQWQIPPGTPFAALPPHWTCPHCSAQQERFLVVAE